MVSESSEARQEEPRPGEPDPLGEAKERRLVERCQRGDVEAFERLVLAFQDQVFALAYRMLHDRDEAEDVAQEVFLSCYRNIQTFRFESRLGTWLYRITANRVKNRWKYHQRRQRERHESIDEPRSEEDPRAREFTAPEPDPRRQAAGRQVAEILRERMALLSDEYREALVLRFSQDLSYEQIAEVVGCSIGTVKSRINRARKQLRESMRDVL